MTDEIDEDGKVVTGGRLKIIFALNKTDYELGREVAEPEIPVV